MTPPRVTKKQNQAHEDARRRNGLKLIHGEILTDLHDQLPQFQIPQLFIIWYLEAKFGIDPDEGQRYVTDGSKDKGIDALYIDSHNRCIHLIQSKYSKQPRGTQNRQDLIMAADVARCFRNDDDEEFERWIGTARQEVQDLGRDAYERIWHRDYELHVHFVTCKSVSDNLRADIKSDFYRIKRSKITVVSVDEVISTAEQYFDGEVPAIDKMTVVPIADQSMIHHKDSASLHSYICEVKCKKFATSISTSRFPLRLYFHRNIRGFLGDTQAVNADILNTLRNEPKLFFYLNNGITILTTGVKKDKDSLILHQPQIINGQQTTNVLVKLGKKTSSTATVLVRIIVLDRVIDYEHVRDLIGQIVKATNWQSAISKADLRSNDPEQIRLQRHMARRNCFYERKRGKAASFRPTGRRYQATIKKEKLAQAVGACEFDQRIIRSGVDHLFDDAMYSKIFSKKKKVDWYLARYFTERAVDRAKRRADKQSVWSYAKWMVVNYVWSQIYKTVTPGGRVMEVTRRYVDALTQGRSNPAVKKCIEAMALHAYRASSKFYKARADGRDESLFFRDQTGLNKEFEKFMRSRATQHQRKMIKKYSKQLADELAIDS